MPNKTLTFKTDILPYSSEGYNIGDSTNKWKVNGYVVSAAAEKNVTDNTTPTAPNSSDQNLITGRTLYNAIASESEIDALFN